MKRALTVLVFVIGFDTKAMANVLGLFPAGPSCKSSAMESAIDCKEPQTLLYNPAMLSLAKSGFTGELGLARLAYSYEHPDFDPVKLNLVTPMFSEGWKGPLWGDYGSWGFAVMPGSMADLNLDGLPRRVMGNPESLNIKAKRRTFHIPLGVQLKQETLGLDLGASVIYTYDERALRGSPVTTPSTKLVDLKARGHFVRPVIGAHTALLGSNVGLSYMFPLIKRYDGKTKIASEPAEFKTELVEYDPGVLLLGAQQTFGPFSFSQNVNYLFGTKGKNLARDGLNRKTTKADLKDARQLGLRLSYDTDTLGSFSLGLSYLDSYWGDGHYTKDPQGFTRHETGNVFGAFNAIPVRNQAVTWLFPWQHWQTHVALFRSAGTTTVGSTGDNPGYYQLEFISLTCGLRRIL